METIKVNMNPNQLDVQTIHASQNDGEAREWEFELHNNGEVIDSGGITDQIVFKAYEGGTEELLPSSLINGYVDMGTLNWEYNSTYDFFAVFYTARKGNTPVVAQGYTWIGFASDTAMTSAKNMSIGDNMGQWLKVRNTSYTDAASFKQAVSGVTLWYAKTDSTPSTTPINADIKYPQGLLADQEFTYRESPTEEDGLANIVGIKGQTIKWNQVCCKERYFARGAVESQGTYTTDGVTFTYLDDYTVRITGTPTARAYVYANRLDNYNYPGKQGDKLLLRCSDVPNGIDIFSSFYNDDTWKGAGPGKSNKYVTVPSDVNKIVLLGLDVQASLIGQPIDVTVSLNFFNLTQMFGSGNEPTEEEFNSLFPIYYPYNSGSLIPFMGNGIKTVGFNQWDEEWEVGAINSTTGENQASNSQIRSKNYTEILPNTTYYFHVGTPGGGSNWQSRFYDADFNYIGTGGTLYYNRAFETPSNAKYLRFSMQNAYGTVYKNDICINISSSRDGEYEPNTSSALSLPISTYFPTGMKSVGSVYDELTESKAITRIGVVDMGTLDWAAWTTLGGEYRMANANGISALAKHPTSTNVEANLLCANYPTLSANNVYTRNKGVSLTSSGEISIYDPSFNTQASTEAFKTAMSGVYLYYELATPTETSFTTASLVTENAEIPLSNEDGVLIGKCTEELSAEPGFHDAKIKLSDADGECYSNKIQLHVERSPQ